MQTENIVVCIYYDANTGICTVTPEVEGLTSALTELINTLTKQTQEEVCEEN